MTIMAIIGSRTFTSMALVSERASELCANHQIVGIVSGGADGADTLGAEFAKANKIPLRVFKPDWSTHGRGAGFIRNKLIVDAADLVLAFWDGRSKGTQHAIAYAKQMNKPVHVVRQIPDLFEPPSEKPA